jgi:hypothetical protein
VLALCHLAEEALSVFSSCDLLAMSNAELARVDPVVMNLLVAKGLPALADLDITSYVRLRDRWASEVARRLPSDEREFRATPKDWENCVHMFRLGVVCHHLGERLGISYKETCAIGFREGKPPVYLGGVRWGFHYKGREGRNIMIVFDPEKPEPLNDAPPELGHALRRWNAATGKVPVEEITGVDLK